MSYNKPSPVLGGLGLLVLLLISGLAQVPHVTASQDGGGSRTETASHRSLQAGNAKISLIMNTANPYFCLESWVHSSYTIDLPCIGGLNPSYNSDASFACSFEGQDPGPWYYGLTYVDNSGNLLFQAGGNTFGFVYSVPMLPSFARRNDRFYLVTDCAAKTWYVKSADISYVDMGSNCTGISNAFVAAEGRTVYTTNALLTTHPWVDSILTTETTNGMTNPYCSGLVGIAPPPLGATNAPFVVENALPVLTPIPTLSINSSQAPTTVTETRTELVGEAAWFLDENGTLATCAEGQITSTILMILGLCLGTIKLIKGMSELFQSLQAGNSVSEKVDILVTQLFGESVRAENETFTEWLDAFYFSALSGQTNNVFSVTPLSNNVAANVMFTLFAFGDNVSGYVSDSKRLKTAHPTACKWFRPKVLFQILLFFFAFSGGMYVAGYLVALLAQCILVFLSLGREYQLRARIRVLDEQIQNLRKFQLDNQHTEESTCQQIQDCRKFQFDNQHTEESTCQQIQNLRKFQLDNQHTEESTCQQIQDLRKFQLDNQHTAKEESIRQQIQDLRKFQLNYRIWVALVTYIMTPMFLQIIMINNDTWLSQVSIPLLAFGTFQISFRLVWMRLGHELSEFPRWTRMLDFALIFVAQTMIMTQVIGIQIAAVCTFDYLSATNSFLSGLYFPQVIQFYSRLAFTKYPPKPINHQVDDIFVIQHDKGTGVFEVTPVRKTIAGKFAITGQDGEVELTDVVNSSRSSVTTVNSSH